MKIEKGKKLITNLHDKTEYFIQMRNLKQVLNNGLDLKKIRRLIKFNRNKAGLFESNFLGVEEVNLTSSTLSPFISQGELMQYQYNFIQLLNNLFRIG